MNIKIKGKYIRGGEKMSVFSEYFNQIKERRELTAAQIAEISGKDRSLIFYWSMGKHLPENWKQVEDVVYWLQLSMDERKRLREAYEKEKLGEKKYACFSRIEKFLNELAQRRKEYSFQILQEIPSLIMTDIPNSLILNDKLEIFYWIQRILENLMLEQEKRLYLKFTDNVPEILMLIKMFCRQTNDCEIKEIVYIVEGTEHGQVYNVEILEKMIEVFEQQNNVEIYICKKKIYGEDFDTNWIITDKSMLQFDNKVSEGILIAEPGWVEFYKELWEKTKKSGSCLGKKRFSIQDFVGYSILLNAKKGYSIEYMPCLGYCLTEEIIENNIYPDIPEREVIIRRLLKNIIHINKEEIQWNNFFWAEGLEEFMEVGRVENFPYGVYTPLDLEERCIVLENLIALAKKKRFRTYIVKTENMKPLKGIYLAEMEMDQQKYLVINSIVEGKEVEQIEITSEELKELLIEYLEYLKEYEKVYTEEETIAYMEELLQKYKRRLREKKENE